MKITSTKINILFADDQLVLREGIYSMFKEEPSINIMGHASNGVELLEQTAQHQPDVVLTDIKMPAMNGIEATRQIMQQFPGIGVIAFTMYSEDYLILDMRDAGALGFVLKDADFSEILTAIHTVYKGEQYLCTETRRKFKQLKVANLYDPDTNTRKAVLSNRERQVLINICMQKTNAEIAEEMSISIKTVEVFRKKIYEKTNCKNIAGLVQYAIRLGIYNIQNID